jgi:hypothetical protein
MFCSALSVSEGFVVALDCYFSRFQPVAIRDVFEDDAEKHVNLTVLSDLISRVYFGSIQSGSCCILDDNPRKLTASLPSEEGYSRFFKF